MRGLSPLRAKSHENLTPPTLSLSLLPSLFYGTLRQRLIAPTHEGARRVSTHDSENVFSILPVIVSDEGYDLYDGLSSYFHSTAQLDSNTVSMEITLVDLPPVLQIQLQVRLRRCGLRVCVG